MSTYENASYEENGQWIEIIHCKKCGEKLFKSRRPAHPTKEAKKKAFVENRSLERIILNNDNHHC